MAVNLVAAYLRQTLAYHSTSKGEMLPVAEMAPKHCANAANKMLAECDWWVQDARANTGHPELWIATQPLWQALAKRGAEEA